jgi:hypothetical protein
MQITMISVKNTTKLAFGILKGELIDYRRRPKELVVSVTSSR